MRAPGGHAKTKSCGPGRPGKPVQADLKEAPGTQGGVLPSAPGRPVGGEGQLGTAAEDKLGPRFGGAMRGHNPHLPTWTDPL